MFSQLMDFLPKYEYNKCVQRCYVHHNGAGGIAVQDGVQGNVSVTVERPSHNHMAVNPTRIT